MVFGRYIIAYWQVHSFCLLVSGYSMFYLSYTLHVVGRLSTRIYHNRGQSSLCSPLYLFFSANLNRRRRFPISARVQAGQTPLSSPCGSAPSPAPQWAGHSRTATNQRRTSHATPAGVKHTNQISTIDNR